MDLRSLICCHHYDLELTPDADNLRFQARVRITIHVKVSIPVIVLNADDLTFDRVVLDKDDTAASVDLDKKLQRAKLTFVHPVATGRHTPTIDYHGAIGTATTGFFAMDYNSPAGKRRTLATNFEPASERRFMPSWDEPGLKATFSVSVEVPSDRDAVSNMPVASTDSLPNGHKRVHFATTPKMSTYLLFLGIGDFERIDTKVDGTDVGVVVSRGDPEKGKYALSEAARASTTTTATSEFATRFPSLTSLQLPELSPAVPWKTGVPSSILRTTCCLIQNCRQKQIVSNSQGICP